MTAAFHDLDGTSVYIAGGGFGIGAAIADGFIAKGAHVAFFGRPDADACAAEMEAKQDRAPLFLQGDITDTAHLQATIAQASEANGTADLPLQKRGAASIINLSFISYMMSSAGGPPSVAANGGITAMTRGLALAKDGIHVNAAAPGRALTDKQLEKLATSEGRATHFDRQGLEPHLVPQDVVSAAPFLASDTSRMMTGQCPVVGGGVVAPG